MGIGQVLLDFSGWTSAHGVPHVGQAKWKVFKIIWLLIVLTSVGFLSYNVSQLAQLYLSNPVNTGIELHFDDLAFPAVTICNINNYKMAKMSETYSSASTGLLGLPTPLTGALPMADSLLYSVYGKHLHNLTHLNNLGHQLKEMVVTCRFGRTPCNMSQDFITWVDPMYGNCFTFNFDSTYTSRKAGAVDGLFMEIDINKTQYLPTTQVSGIKVVIHDPSEDPFPDTNGYFAGVGVITSVALNMVSTARQPAPYGNCVKDKSVVPTFWYSGSYTREACQRSCYQKKVIALGCADPQYPNPNPSTPTCPNDTMLKAAMSSLSKDACVQSCGSQCEETAYLASLSNAYFPSDTYNASTCNDPISNIERTVLGNQTLTGVLNNTIQLLSAITGLLENVTSLLKPLVGLLGGTTLGNLLNTLISVAPITNVLSSLTPLVDSLKRLFCLADIKTSRLQLQVFYVSLSYQYVSETPGYGLVNLISDCGGQLGLWLGFSVITAVEVVTLIGKLMLEVFKCNKKKKMNDPINRMEPPKPLGIYETTAIF